MKKRLSLFALILTFSLSIILSGCGSSPTSGSKGAENKKQEVTYATTSKPVGMSPILTNDSVSSNIIEHVYETLFTRDSKTGEIQPLLAESFENPDDNTWVIKLKKNVKFHDGTSFNAEAVKYTFDKLKDPKTAAPRASLLKPVSSIEVKDEYTVVLKTEQPYGAMLAALAHTNASIVSPAADQKQDLMTNPVGTGPFKFLKKENGDDVVLEKNKDYWRNPAKLDKVTFKVVPDVNTAISMLQTGQVQFIDGTPADLLPRLQKINSVETLKKKGTPLYYVVFNANKAPMNDIKFREAVAYAIDYKGYIKKLNGLGYESKGFMGPELFGYDKSIEDKGIHYNLGKAKQLVKEGNFGDKPFKILTPNTPVYMKLAEAVQAQLTEAGFNVKLESIEWGAYLDVSKKGEFDVAFSGWSNVTGDGSELFYPRLHSDSVGSSNLGQYKNSELDQLINESRTTIDPEQRKQKLKEANEFVAKELPVVPIYHSVVNVTHDKSLEGIELDATGQWSLYKAYRK
ncbi:MAG: ABC transporter substrate-binding protein [Ectobacillus sp.]